MDHLELIVIKHYERVCSHLVLLTQELQPNDQGIRRAKHLICIGEPMVACTAPVLLTLSRANSGAGFYKFMTVLGPRLSFVIRGVSRSGRMDGG